MLEGSCFCGFVRYEASGEVSHETACHCGICRRVHAAPFVAWFTVPRGGFRLVAGEPTSFASSEAGTRSFCPRCGTPLTFASSALPHAIDVATCTLRSPEDLPPRDHTYDESRLGWVELGDGLPRHATSRP